MNPTDPPPRRVLDLISSTPGNRLLAAMTRAERGLLSQAMEPVDLVSGATLFAPGQPIEHVVLPEEGLVSLVAELPDGTRVEVGMVGREGCAGLHVLLGQPDAPCRAVVQVPGHGHRIGVAALSLAADGSRNLRDLMRRQAMAALLHTSSTAACNISHPLERRAARWLLGVQDRVGAGVPITQEYLALMFEARRPTVNVVVQGLKAAGLIRTARGQVAVVDRAGLEAAACPCCHAGRAALDRLLPGALGKG